jgi:hypothetical protein
MTGEILIDKALEFVNKSPLQAPARRDRSRRQPMASTTSMAAPPSQAPRDSEATMAASDPAPMRRNTLNAGHCRF